MTAETAEGHSFMHRVVAQIDYGLVATGPRRGCRVLRPDRTGADAEAAFVGKRCAEVAGFNVHANVRLSAHDRDGLEHLCRYLARPPATKNRLVELPDSRPAPHFKQAWRDGTTHTVYTPHELIEKLIPLIPRPRCHLVRYHGILAPAAKGRAKVVPTPSAPKTPEVRNSDTVGATETHEISVCELPRNSHLPCAVLLKRVFMTCSERHPGSVSARELL